MVFGVKPFASLPDAGGLVHFAIKGTSPYTSDVQLSPPGEFSITGKNLEKLKLALNAKTGLFTGSIKSDGVRRSFAGVLDQPADNAAGFALNPAGSDAVEMTFP